MMEAISQKISDLFNNKYAHTSIFLVDIQIQNDNKILVFADSDTGLSIDKCVEISRYISSGLDQTESILEDYALEVSSPGLNQALKEKRQYKKNVGRMVSVTLNDGSVEQGRLLLVDDNNIMIEQAPISIKGRKAKKEKVTFKNIEFDQISMTKVEVTF